MPTRAHDQMLHPVAQQSQNSSETWENGKMGKFGKFQNSKFLKIPVRQGKNEKRKNAKTLLVAALMEKMNVQISISALTPSGA